MSVQALHRAQSPGLAARQACPSARQPSSSIAWRVGSSSKAAKAHRTPFLASPPPPCRRSSQGAWRLASPVAAIRGVQDFDGTFTLEQQQQETLVELLTSDLFCQQVVRECKLPEGTQVEFSGTLFQPVPWSPATKKGMSKEVEDKYYGKEEYTIINVPPVFMFQAKIFQPPRLCAIYKRK